MLTVGFDRLLTNADELQKMKQASLKRYEEEFSDNKDLKAYEALLTQYLTDVQSENVSSISVKGQPSTNNQKQIQ